MLLPGDLMIHNPVDLEALGRQVSFLSELSLSELFVVNVVLVRSALVGGLRAAPTLAVPDVWNNDTDLQDKATAGRIPMLHQSFFAIHNFLETGSNEGSAILDGCEKYFRKCY